MRCLLGIVLGMWVKVALGLSFPLPAPGEDIVGEIQTVIAQPGDTLASVGQRYNIGYAEMEQANWEIAERSLKAGEKVLIPSQFILPSVRKGIVVNLAELRLYYFPENWEMVLTFPVGVGTQGWNTPQASGSVIRKAMNPIWYVPLSIQAENARKGIQLPKVVLPGPKNPLGKYALYLSIPSVLLHGTNAPHSVGRRSSHGCIRLLAPDIEYLFHYAPAGTPIQIIYEQDKIGWLKGQLYLESEVPFEEFENDAQLKTRIRNAAQGRVEVNWKKVSHVTDMRLGMPVSISPAL